MNLYEYEGKALLKEYGIPVPESVLLDSMETVPPLPLPFVLKAQVMTGGRGKAGGIRVCRDMAEFRVNAREIMNMQIKGHSVQALLCEQMQKPVQEIYAAITLQGVSVPTLIVSAAGGMEIEEVARTASEKLIKMEIDPFIGLKEYQLKRMAAAVAPDRAAGLIDMVRKLARMFMDTQALLTEINPLGILEDGSLIAMDAKVVLDDHSVVMGDKRNAIEAARARLPKYVPAEKEKTTITYVPLDQGNIGLISDGAGTGMLTLDLISDAGGQVASFCELGGTTPAEVMYRAMQLTMEKGDRLRAVIVVLIGGFNRMDDMANGIVSYLKEHNIRIPIFTRMCGTMEEEGKAIMADAGLATYYDLGETVAAAVDAARGAN